MKGEKEMLLELENFIIKFLSDRDDRLAKIERSDFPEKILTEARNFDQGMHFAGAEILNKITELTKGKEVKKEIKK